MDFRLVAHREHKADMAEGPNKAAQALMASMLAEEPKDSLIVSVRAFGRHGV